eukprot:SM000013S26587  [mRNA]  locus=s13:1282761:1283134:+ [translate_table: standard]
MSVKGGTKFDVVDIEKGPYASAGLPGDAQEKGEHRGARGPQFASQSLTIHYSQLQIRITGRMMSRQTGFA